MEHKDQRPIETVESRMSESSEERQDKNYGTRPYRAPQVFLVGKAKRLMTSSSSGVATDAHGLYAYS
jgi:hypothetical protein